MTTQTYNWKNGTGPRPDRPNQLTLQDMMETPLPFAVVRYSEDCYAVSMIVLEYPVPNRNFVWVKMIASGANGQLFLGDACILEYAPQTGENWNQFTWIEYDPHGPYRHRKYNDNAEADQPVYVDRN